MNAAETIESFAVLESWRVEEGYVSVPLKVIQKATQWLYFAREAIQPRGDWWEPQAGLDFHGVVVLCFDHDNHKGITVYIDEEGVEIIWSVGGEICSSDGSDVEDFAVVWESVYGK